MVLQAEHLGKLYGEQWAVRDLSFGIGKGEIVGFLGPNGAGKSTTMKILTGFIPPSAGTASVCGLDVAGESLELRRRIGYLPEHNPLYLDLYVVEYLEFVARLFGLPRKRERIREMIAMTGLEPERHKRIRQLSKGYRQRVGLAQAMINDPEVLILDEPTTGLDPNQLADIRELIRELGREKTVLLSTHIMQEVQALCDRVLIIHQGRLVADSPTEELAARASGAETLSIRFKAPVPGEQLRSLPGVTAATAVAETAERAQAEDSASTWRLELGPGSEDVEEAVFKLAVDRGYTLLGSERSKQNLEDVFRALTKGAGPAGSSPAPGAKAASSAAHSESQNPTP
jgi:ABC-2 type transport system ATP-binding protein